MPAELVSYIAELLRPWVGTATVVAAVSFTAFVALRSWALARILFLTRRGAPAAGSGGGTRGVALSRLVDGLFKSMGLAGSVLGRVAATAALIACAGVAASAFASPASAGAGMGMPALALAQQALKAAMPADYARIADLTSPEVTTRGETATYTFHVPKKAGAKNARARTFSVTVGPKGAQVRQTR